MLGNDYIKIDNVAYTPSDFSYELQALEKVNQSEAGTELVSVVRLDKHVFHATWEGITSTLLDAIEALCKKPTVTLLYRNVSYTCRARGIAPQLLKKTYKYRRSDGLWNISIDLTQI